MELRYHKELDGIRAIAALMVMFFHFFQSFLSDQPILKLIQKISIFGQTGVSLFFVLSGFLITRILIQTKTNKKYFLNFYVRRSLRIFPLYYLFLILTYYILPLINGAEIPSFQLQIYYWIYMQDFAMTFNWPSNGPHHFWSLAIEEHFYMFWPFLIYWLKEKQVLYTIALLIVSSVIVRVILTNNNLEVYYFTFSRLDELAIGALLSLLEIRNKLVSKNAGKFLLLFFLVLIPTVLIWIVNSASGNSTIQVVKFFLLSLAYFSIIGFVVSVSDSHFIKKALRWQPLTYTGKISYGLYVYHPICFWVIYHQFNSASFIKSFTTSFAFAYLVASVSYYLIENNFLKLKRFFADTSKKSLAPA